MEPPWQAAREAAAKRTSFLADLLTQVVLSGLLRIHRDLHYSAGTAQKSKNRMTQVKKPTFRIAGVERFSERGIPGTTRGNAARGRLGNLAGVNLGGWPVASEPQCARQASYVENLYRHAGDGNIRRATAL